MYCHMSHIGPLKWLVYQPVIFFSSHLILSHLNVKVLAKDPASEIISFNKDLSLFSMYFLKEPLAHILIADLINSAKWHCYGILRLVDSL